MEPLILILVIITSWSEVESMFQVAICLSILLVHEWSIKVETLLVEFLVGFLRVYVKVVIGKLSSNLCLKRIAESGIINKN